MIALICRSSLTTSPSVASPPGGWSCDQSTDRWWDQSYRGIHQRTNWSDIRGLPVRREIQSCFEGQTRPVNCWTFLKPFYFLFILIKLKIGPENKGNIVWECLNGGQFWVLQWFSTTWFIWLIYKLWALCSDFWALKTHLFNREIAHHLV